MKNICKSKYIIFDFDGVIVDSEKLYYKAWKEASLFNGYNLTHEQLLTLRSCDKSIAKNLFGDIDDYNRVREKRREIMNANLALNKFELKGGIVEAFKYLKNNDYKIIIASSSPLDMVKMHLDYYDLNKYIDDTLSVKSIKRGKPYPDIYLEVCKHYNLVPNEVIAIEDSPNGIRSAYDAGLNVIMIPDLTNPTIEEQKILTYVLDNVNEIKNIL